MQAKPRASTRGTSDGQSRTNRRAWHVHVSSSREGVSIHPCTLLCAHSCYFLPFARCLSSFSSLNPLSIHGQVETSGIAVYLRCVFDHAKTNQRRQGLRILITIAQKFVERLRRNSPAVSANDNHDQVHHRLRAIIVIVGVPFADCLIRRNAIERKQFVGNLFNSERLK